MAYMCDYMRGTVVYDQDRISFTLTQCGENSDYLYAKAEMSAHSCTATEETGKLLAHPTLVVIEDISK